LALVLAMAINMTNANSHASSSAARSWLTVWPPRHACLPVWDPSHVEAAHLLAGDTVTGVGVAG
jgi:hypothetical protein